MISCDKLQPILFQADMMGKWKSQKGNERMELKGGNSRGMKKAKDRNKKVAKL